MFYYSFLYIILHLMGVAQSAPIPPSDQQLLNRFCTPAYIYPDGETPIIGMCVIVSSKDFCVDQNNSDRLFSRCRKVT